MLHKCIFGCLAMSLLLAPVLMLVPEEATSTESAMLLLPAYSKYRCAACHTSASPATGDAALNGFGVDFKAAGSQWTPELALANSDGDKCSNGFELGDRDGDGLLDPGTTAENSNPGVQDCTVPVDRRTWGIIKDMFRSQLSDYSAVEMPDVWELAYSS